MAGVTAFLVGLSFVTGCITLVVGYGVGHGTGSMAAHLGWGMLTLVLQLFSTGVATVHARASSHEIALLNAELERLDAERGAGPGPDSV